MSFNAQEGVGGITIIYYKNNVKVSLYLAATVYSISILLEDLFSSYRIVYSSYLISIQMDGIFYIKMFVYLFV